MKANSPASGWLVVLAAFFGVMVGFGSVVVFSFGVFLKPLSAEFGWSREAVSRAFGLAALSVAVASPKLGHWLDRVGPRRVILPCFAIYGLALGSLAFLTPSLYHFYAVFIVIGLVGNATTQMGYSRAVTTWFDHRRGLALALVMAGTGIGAMILPASVQALIDAYGWRAAYLALGTTVLLVGLPLTILFVRERPHASTRSTEPEAGANTKQTFASRAFWILVAVLFANSVSVNGAITHLSALLTDHGLSTGDAALALSALGGASLFGRLLTGWLLDRAFGPHVAAALLVLTSAGIAWVASAGSVLAAAPAAALIGLGLGGEADITPYLLSRYFGLQSFSTLYGFTWTAYATAGAIGPVVMGRAFDLTGSYTALLQLLACVMLASAGLMLLMPRYRKTSDVALLSAEPQWEGNKS